MEAEQEGDQGQQIGRRPGREAGPWTSGPTAVAGCSPTPAGRDRRRLMVGSVGGSKEFECHVGRMRTRAPIVPPYSKSVDSAAAVRSLWTTLGETATRSPCATVVGMD